MVDGRMPVRGRLVPGLVLAGLLLASAGASANNPNEAESAVTLNADASVDQCVALTTEQTDKDVRFQIKNDCSVQLRCTLSWKFRCGPESDTPPPQRTKQTSVWANDSASLSARDPSCTDDTWAVLEPTWSCDPIK